MSAVQKIGILTFHLGPNHGGFLQAWSLAEFLKSEGFEVEIINYKNQTLYEDEKFKPWVYRRPFKLYHEWVKRGVFEKLYRQLPLSEFSTDPARISWNQYGAIVVGSDVVWDYRWERLGKDPAFFGHFGEDFQGKLISYAPSVGTVKPETPIPEWVGIGLEKFSAISVRDRATGDLVEKALGTRPLQVVDPTWLDMEFFEDSSERDPLLVVYAYSMTPEMRDETIHYARKHGLRIVAVGYFHGWADENNLRMSPLEWPALLKRARAVVAGTFHGTLYALKTQCAFVTPWNPTIENRVGSILRDLDLEDRMIRDAGQLGKTLDQQLDYQQIKSRASVLVNTSRDFLKKALS